VDKRIDPLKAELMKLEDVVGVGYSEGLLIIFMRKENKKTYENIKKIVRDIKYKIEITGEFRALK